MNPTVSEALIAVLENMRQLQTEKLINDEVARLMKGVVPKNRQEAWIHYDAAMTQARSANRFEKLVQNKYDEILRAFPRESDQPPTAEWALMLLAKWATTNFLNQE